MPVDVEGVRGLQIDGERVRVRARTGASLPRYEDHLTPVRTTAGRLAGPDYSGCSLCWARLAPVANTVPLCCHGAKGYDESKQASSRSALPRAPDDMPSPVDRYVAIMSSSSGRGGGESVSPSTLVQVGSV